jgi:hypothetical protein
VTGTTDVPAEGVQDRRDGDDTVDDGDVIYHGYREPVDPCVIEIRDETGGTLGVVSHVHKHADGMQWGFPGSGPADCARSLLIAALGDEAKCLRCQGDPGRSATCPWMCDRGYRPLPYEQFTMQFVCDWGESWSMSRTEILAWYADTCGRHPGRTDWRPLPSESREWIVRQRRRRPGHGALRRRWLGS